jgi:hypothetical protein
MTIQIDGRARVVSDVLAERIARGLEGALASQSREERQTVAAADIRALREDVGIEMKDKDAEWGSDELVAAVVRGLAEASSTAARALRAIPRARRALASRDNGKRGGRPRKQAQ